MSGESKPGSFQDNTRVSQALLSCNWLAQVRIWFLSAGVFKRVSSLEPRTNMMDESLISRLMRINVEYVLWFGATVWPPNLAPLVIGFHLHYQLKGQFLGIFLLTISLFVGPFGSKSIRIYNSAARFLSRRSVHQIRSFFLWLRASDSHDWRRYVFWLHIHPSQRWMWNQIAQRGIFKGFSYKLGTNVHIVSRMNWWHVGGYR